jgi:predicted ArsR family transcriptional regulator
MIRISEHRYSSLAKVLIFLHYQKIVLKADAAFTVSALASNTGCSPSYIKGKASRWREWGYIDGRIQLMEGRPVFCYRLASKGEKFVDQLRAEQAQWFEVFRHELSDHRKAAGLS